MADEPRKSRIKDTWKNASPLVKTLTGIFTFVTLGASAIGVIWQCSSGTIKTANNVKSIPEVSRCVDSLLRMREADKHDFLDSCKDLRGHMDKVME